MNKIYIEETWINNMIVNTCWRNEEMIGILKNSNFSRFIIHTSGKNGFIKEALLIFKAYSITGDYHG